MSKRISRLFALSCAVLLAFASGAGYAETGDGGAQRNVKPRPLVPNSPSPLAPLAPSPSGPTPGAPIQAPPPVYPVGPTAEEDSVLQRRRPEFDPVGIELGALAAKVGVIDRSTDAAKKSALSSFEVFPKVEFQSAYDSNLFRNKTEIADEIFITSPSISIRSDWTRHALEFFGSANVARYNRTSTENYEDILGRVSGRADIADNFSVNGLVQYGRDHQRRGEIIDPGDTSEATVINRGRLELGAALELAAVTLSAKLESETNDFVSSATVDNDDLDHDMHTVTLRTSLEVDPGTSIFIQPKYNRRIYRHKIDSSGFEQNSHGYEVLGGVRWDASGVTFVELGLGYLWQNYDESRFDTIQGVTASAQAIWNFSDLWTLTLGLSRTVSETADQDLSGVLNTKFDSRLDYEFLYNTVFSLHFAYSDEDYKSSTRLDNRTVAGFAVKHLFNRYLFAALDVQHERLNSNRDTEGFKVTTGSLRLGAQY